MAERGGTDARSGDPVYVARRPEAADLLVGGRPRNPGARKRRRRTVVVDDRRVGVAALASRLARVPPRGAARVRARRVLEQRADAVARMTAIEHRRSRDAARCRPGER